MSNTGLKVFDESLQKTHIWLNEIDQHLQWDSTHNAYRALREVLHVLRDRLPVEEVADLGAQLPLVIRGVYYEGWRPAGKPDKDIKREDFISIIDQAFSQMTDVRAEDIIAAVLKTLSRHVTGGEVGDIKHLLPKAIRDLWPEEVTT